MYTIDDTRTRDMDDAVEVQSTDTGWTVRISIADAAKYVPAGSDLDKLARERGATQYFASGNSPMLPRELAEWKLSLFPNKVRKSLNVEVLLDLEANVTSRSVQLGKVLSQAKLSYTEVPTILEQEGHPQHQSLNAARSLAMGLLHKRREAGALIFYDLNKGWVTTEDGTLKKLKRREDTIGYVIIQELMILTNCTIAQYMEGCGIPTLFRNHEARSAAPEREALMKNVAALLDAPVMDLESLQKQNYLLFNRAEYGVQNVGHFGLNEKAYLHFSSPIRRYADLVTHQQLRAHLKGEPLPYSQDQVMAIATHLNTLNQALRDKAKKSYVAMADGRARQNIEARKLDGLPAKAFERAVKVEVRSGNSPSDSLVEAWIHRLDQNTVPNLCLTEVLMLLDGAEGWDTLREAAIEALEERPADAVAVIHQAQSLGWGVPNFEVQQTGPNHQPTFICRGLVEVGPQTFTTRVVCPSGGSSRLVKQQAAVELLRNIVHRKGGESLVEIQGTAVLPPSPVKPVKSVVEAKNSVSVLMEISQARKVPAPSYTCVLTGPPHAPVVTCTVTFLDFTAQGVAANKQDAKKAAAEGLLKKAAL
jgi:ribonuclease R